MDDKEYESRVTQCFITVTGIVEDRRKVKFAEQRLASLIKRMNVDPRILEVLMNEYEHYLEDHAHKMKKVPQIREELRVSDAEREKTNAKLYYEWASESGGGH